MTRLHVFHSNDYAQNFSEYVHILDDTYNDNPIQVFHTVAATVNPTGSGTVEGSGKYYEGEEVSLIATPAEGYNFINWTEKDSVVSDEPEYSFIAESTRTLKANFQLANSVHNYKDNNKLMVFPNPGSSHIMVSVTDFSSCKNPFLVIYNIYGQKQMSIPIKNEQTRINISALPAGTYNIPVY